MIEDERIVALFAAPERAPDEVFVARIARGVAAEQRAAAARAAAWRRFAVECAGSAAVITAFWLVWRLAPAALPLDGVTTVPAAAAAILILGLWFAIELRPSATAR